MASRTSFPPQQQLGRVWLVCTYSQILPPGFKIDIGRLERRICLLTQGYIVLTGSRARVRIRSAVRVDVGDLFCHGGVLYHVPSCHAIW